MACKKCKKKEQRTAMQNEIKKFERPALMGLTIMGLLVIYGLLELVFKIISLF